MDGITSTKKHKSSVLQNYAHEGINHSAQNAQEMNRDMFNISKTAQQMKNGDQLLQKGKQKSSKRQNHAKSRKSISPQESKKQKQEKCASVRCKVPGKSKTIVTEVHEGKQAFKLSQKNVCLSQTQEYLKVEKTSAATCKNDEHQSLQTKRKRSREKEDGHLVKQIRLDSAGQKTAAEQLKGVSQVLTRKQRRNRKKNSSKKNKYKHLALSKEDQVNKIFMSAENNGSNVKSLSVFAVSKSGNEMSSTAEKAVGENERLAQLNSLSVSKKQKVSGTKKVTPDKPDYVKKHAAKKQGMLHTVHTKTSRNPWESSFSTDSNNTTIYESEDVLPVTANVSATHKKSDQSKKKRKVLSVAEQAHEKLNAARFRFLNEQLYTQTGAEALKMFQDDPEAFQVYHNGFQAQVSRWPVNPLDVIIEELSKMPKNVTVADFGCGDGHLAESLPQNQVHSFDLVSSKPFITACDIAKVPLANSSVNVAVFCLSLMGTNLSDYLIEANRVLEKGGLLKIAEVVSRFYSVNRFVRNVEDLGFRLQKKVCLGKMFLLMTFRKVHSSRKQGSCIQLKACHYKRR